jgi:hypothetical protein
MRTRDKVLRDKSNIWYVVVGGESYHVVNKDIVDTISTKATSARLVVARKDEASISIFMGDFEPFQMKKDLLPFSTNAQQYQFHVEGAESEVRVSEIDGYSLRLLSDAPQVVRLAEEVTVAGQLIEGAVCQVIINAYERKAIARARCIAHYGPSCVVCGFNFGAVYGQLADGFIHVHHIKPLSEIGAEYEVDPVADLRPVCPNCHAVIHLGGECRGIEEVRKLLQRSTIPNS